MVFMGTPQFALPSLRAILASRQRLVGVYTQGDKPSGRGGGLASPPVKQLALERGLPVFQPPSLRREEARRELAELKPDLIVVVAYGKILPQEVLDIPPHGCLNVHPSLLPRHRGPSPIATAILEGDEFTGVTIIKLDAGMDTGPIVAQERVRIEPEDATGSLTLRLSQLGADMLKGVILPWCQGEIEPIPQGEDGASVTRIFQKEDGLMDWSLPAEALARRVRGFYPWPGVFIHWKGRLLKIHEAYSTAFPGGNPGKVIPLGDGCGVTCGQGVLGLKVVQLEGKRSMPIGDFLRGQRDFIGSVLGK